MKLDDKNRPLLLFFLVEGEPSEYIINASFFKTGPILFQPASPKTTEDGRTVMAYDQKGYREMEEYQNTTIPKSKIFSISLSDTDFEKVEIRIYRMDKKGEE